MRILFLSRRYFPAISGMSTYAHNLLGELVAAGHEVTMLSQYRQDEAGTRIYGGGPPPPVPGARVVGLRSVGEERFGEPRGADFEGDIETMRAAIAAEHAHAPLDLIHAQYGYPTGWAALLAARDLGLPCVVSIQGGDGHWVGSCCETHRLAMVEVLERASAVLIGCDSFAGEVVERLGIPRERFTIVPGAVDLARFGPDPEPAPREPGAPVRLLYHGRVDARKGSVDFVDALALLRDRGTPFEATVSGIGPDFDATLDRARTRGLGDRVRFPGVSDYDAAPRAYHGQDVFVSPTYAEGFSNTVLEAMASRLAIVSCPVVGVRDCLRDGDNALLVPPGDVPALANALDRLVADPVLRARLADAAHEECRATYSWRRVGERIMAVYARLHDAPPPPPGLAALPWTPCRFRAAPHLL